MKTDYKFWYIKRDDNGFITECAVRFYEGDITTEDEKKIDGTVESITRYRRIKKLQKNDLLYLGEKFEKDSKGNDVKLYTSDDFGQIKTDDELRIFLNQEIKKDVSRIPIIEQ